MTPQELSRYLEITGEIKRLEAELKTVVAAKQELAKMLYERNGRDSTYKVGDEYLIIAPTKQGTYYFVPRVRWSKQAAAAKAEKKKLDRLARMQTPPGHKPDEPDTPAQSPTAQPGRRVELVAKLHAMSSSTECSKADSTTRNSKPSEESQCD